MSRLRQVQVRTRAGGGQRLLTLQLTQRESYGMLKADRKNLPREEPKGAKPR